MIMVLLPVYDWLLSYFCNVFEHIMVLVVKRNSHCYPPIPSLEMLLVIEFCLAY